MYIRKLIIASICLFLISCAGGDVKHGDEQVSKREKFERVDIDSDVEQDFKNAVELMQQDKYAQAVSLLNAVIEREKRLPSPYVNIAIAHNKLGDVKEAEKNLISALKLDIGHPVANNELGLLYRKAGKFNAARTAYENAIKDNPEYLAAKRNLGVLCDLYLHDFNCALEQFEDYLDIAPNDKTVVIWVADVKRRFK
ncbi:MAG: tetratricopeptide repeat protein [Proteobacteria bacterium]|nr:tetratricopeptide repeat protein [Pseudomonadota bacterium]